MKSTTASDYHSRVTRVLTHLAANLDDKHSLQDLASVAAFSPFHFHRMFRAMAGETVGDLVRRLKLERAAYRLRYGDANVTEAALEAGYDSPEAFARAFKRACGLAPSTYADAWPLPPFSRVHPRVHFDVGRHTIELDPITGGSVMDVRIEHFPERRAATLRLVGPYNEAGPLFGRLFGWANGAGVDLRNARSFTLSYDDPDSVPLEELRSDICLGLPQGYEAPQSPLPEGLEIRDLPGCRYAIHRLIGPYDGIHRAYQRLFQHWLPSSGEEVAELPCMELYLNDCRMVPEAELETDICIPLKD